MLITAPENTSRFLGGRVTDLVSKVQDAEFYVGQSYKRAIILKEDFSKISVLAPDIDNLDNDFSRLGILQAFYRFLGLHLCRQGIFLLHASAAMYQGKLIIFGDNGGNLGKTLSSVEAGLVSGAYLADEFLFWDKANNIIISDPNIPIHLRLEVRDHLKAVHGIEQNKEFVDSIELGFSAVNEMKPDAVCYANYREGAEMIKLNPDSAEEFARVTFSAHIAKLLNPALDRFRFSEESDTIVPVKTGGSAILSEISEDLRSAVEEAARDFSQLIPSYRLSASNPCDLTRFLNELKL